MSAHQKCQSISFFASFGLLFSLFFREQRDENVHALKSNWC